jgi:hypothetical protein
MRSILIIFAFHFCLSQLSFGQDLSFNTEAEALSFIKEDYMNLAILVLDFLTYEFLEGSVDYYPLCDSCDLDSLPFIVEFMSPMDYGEILFKYSYNSDTLFYASIWWAGTGQVLYPEEFIPSSEFGYQEETIVLPGHEQYFDFWLTPNGYSWQEFIEKADSAWEAIDSLQITKEFSEYSFRVGIYAYTPVVGLFDPTYAKWIIFLYYGNSFSTGLHNYNNQPILSSVFPNPFTTSTTIEFELKKSSSIQFTVYNVKGDLVYQYENSFEQGTQLISWSPAQLPAGMYYAILGTEEGSSSLKIIKH